MMTRHCSDEELQLFAGGQQMSGTGMIQHMESCLSCQQQIAAYRLIIGTIKEQQAPAFDFDLNAVVMQELQPVKTKHTSNKWYVTPPAVLMTILAISSLYIFRKNFLTLSAGISSPFLIISMIACLCIIGFKVFKLYQRYNLQIKKLNFSD